MIAHERDGGITMTAAHPEQTVLADFSGVSRGPLSPLSMEEALTWAKGVVKGFGGGYQFTAQALFRGVEIVGNKKGRGSIMKYLQGAGLVRPVGVTTKDQESRNNGLATLWEVV